MIDHLLIGPFHQVVTMCGCPLEGDLSDDYLAIHGAGSGILIEEGHIIQIGPFDQLRKDHPNVHELDQPTVALPGFIDAHTHICWAGNRARDYALRLSGVSYQEIAKRGGGILDTVARVRETPLEELTAITVKHTKELLQSGVTTCEVKSGYGLSFDSELKMLRAIRDANRAQPIELIPTCLAAHTKPPEFETTSAYLDFLLGDLLPQVQEEQLSNRVDIFVEKNAFSVEEARGYLLKAKEMGFTLTLHANQFSRGGCQLAAEVGALSADHLEEIAPDDLTAMKEAGVIPVVLPGATLGLGQPFAPARQMLDAGLPLVIASDWNPGSAPMGNLLTQAALIGAAEKLTMAETLAAITCRAAQALELPDRGTIEPGKRADLALFPCSDYREVLYRQGGLRPHSTVVGGALLKHGV